MRSPPSGGSFRSSWRLNVATLVSGALGFVTGVIVTAHAVSSARMMEPTNISFVGVGEALNNVAFALLLVMVGTLAASVGALKLSRLPSEGAGRLRGEA